MIGENIKSGWKEKNKHTYYTSSQPQHHPFILHISIENIFSFSFLNHRSITLPESAASSKQVSGLIFYNHRFKPTGQFF